MQDETEYKSTHVPAHTHGHSQGHSHDGCHHAHVHGGGKPEDVHDEERAVMLGYLLNHNREHVDELRMLVLDDGSSAEHLLNEAIAAYEKANELLGKYLDAKK